MKRYSLGILAFLFVLAGCSSDEPSISEVPAIVFKEFRFERTELGGIPTDFYYVTFEYLDGDGDIGMLEGEESIPGHPDVRHNLFVDYYEEREGVLIKDVECAIGGSISTKKYVLESITPTGNNKSIKGEMTVRLETCETPLDTVKNIKYSLQLVDRKLNYSNIIETPIIPYETQK